MSSSGWQDRIVCSPGTCHGQARVRGTRVIVSTVLDNLAAGLSPDEIVASYPPLTPGDVTACIGYAAELARGLPVPLRIDGAA